MSENAGLARRFFCASGFGRATASHELEVGRRAVTRTCGLVLRHTDAHMGVHAGREYCEQRQCAPCWIIGAQPFELRVGARRWPRRLVHQLHV